MCSLYCCFSFVFFFKQKTAYEMRISDWSSDVCSSDLIAMTPQLLQSIRLLQLSTLELEQELRQALETNVMLEGEDDDMSAIEVDAQANSDERQDRKSVV